MSQSKNYRDRGESFCLGPEDKSNMDSAQLHNDKRKVFMTETEILKGK